MFIYSCISISLAFTVFDVLDISETIAVKVGRAHVTTIDAATTWPPAKSRQATLQDPASAQDFPD